MVELNGFEAKFKDFFLAHFALIFQAKKLLLSSLQVQFTDLIKNHQGFFSVYDTSPLKLGQLNFLTGSNQAVIVKMN